MLIIFQVCITASPSPTRLASAMAFSADVLSSRGLVNLHNRYLKTCMAFGTCALFLSLLSDSAILQYASVVESNFLLPAFVLVLAVTFWHLSTSPWHCSTKEASELMWPLVDHLHFHKQQHRTQIHTFLWLYSRQYQILIRITYFTFNKSSLALFFACQCTRILVELKLDNE